MSKYEGLFVRGYMGDPNNYPKPSGSSVWTSPDIIPYGTNVCIDPEKEFLGGNFEKIFPNNVQGGIQNYVYVRGENMSGAGLDGQMYLYYSDSSMLLVPSTWQRIDSTKGKKYVHFSAKTGERIVCSSDDDGIFAVSPKKPDDHPCLISRIVTERYPAPIPDLKNITDFAIFLRSEQSMGYAQLNLRYLEPKAPNYTLTELLANPFDVPITDAYVIVNLYCVPKESEIQMTCPGSRDGCNLEILKRVITEDTYSKPLSLTARITNMPKGFSYPLNVHFWRNGKPIDGRFSISIDFLAAFSAESPAYALGYTLDRQVLGCLYEEGEALGEQAILRGLELAGPRRAIRVGSCQHATRRNP